MISIDVELFDNPVVYLALTWFVLAVLIALWKYVKRLLV